MQSLFESIDASKYLLNQSLEDKMLRSERDWLVRGFAEGINRERIGTQYKPVTKKVVALRLNSHPIYAISIIEVRNLLTKCERDGFKWFWISTKTTKC